MTRKDLPPLLLLLTAVLAQFAPTLFAGRSYFLGDLTFYYHPWHALSAQMLQAGQIPLWNPYGYMGMPLLGSLQTGLLAPGTLPFHLLPFAGALKVHLLFSHLIAALFGYLWTRRCAGRAGAAAAALAFSLSGPMLSRIWVINHTATLCWWPAFFLFSGRPALRGLAMGCALLAGYPQAWAGMAAGTLLLPWAGGPRRFLPWAKAVGLAVLLAAAVLLPGAEMASRSNRAGLSLEQRTANALAPEDLPAFLSPALIHEPATAGEKYPFWKTVYLGFAGTLLAGAGLRRLRPRTALWVAGFGAAVVLATLGNGNPLSAWLWSAAPPLQWIRFPANLAYLLLAAAIPLVAVGTRGRRWAGAAALFVAGELLTYGFRIQPTMPDSYFNEPGPVVERLRRDLQGRRFAFAPQAALLQTGYGRTPEARYRDVKHRLYGSANLPFRLHGTTGLGESWLLGSSYQAMDFLFTRPSAGAALEVLPWLDAKLLLAKPAGSPAGPVAGMPWSVTDTTGPARARWLPKDQAAVLAGGIENAVRLRKGEPAAYREPRPDRWSVEGSAPREGWVLVANPLYPGWRAALKQDAPAVAARAEPALGAFQSFAVREGRFAIEAVYRPGTWRWGVLVSVATAAGLAGWGWRRVRKA